MLSAGTDASHALSQSQQLCSGPQLSHLTPSRSLGPFVARLLSPGAASGAAALSEAGTLPGEASSSLGDLELLRGKRINHGNGFPKDVVAPQFKAFHCGCLFGKCRLQLHRLRSGNRRNPSACCLQSASRPKFSDPQGSEGHRTACEVFKLCAEVITSPLNLAGGQLSAP